MVAPRGAKRFRWTPRRHLLRRGKNDDENAIFEADRAIRDGGGFVSIIGRNVFQRETADALLLESMMNIYAEGGERQEIID